jgi:hypothetical protein
MEFSSMTNIDLILETLEELMPSSYCDDYLSEQLGIRPRHKVNAICNKLNSQGLILRTKALCPHCRRRKMVNSFKGTFKSQVLPKEVPAPLDGFSKPSLKLSEPEEPYQVFAFSDGEKLQWLSDHTLEEAESPPFLNIEHIRTEIVRMCRHLWHKHKWHDPAPYSISVIINTLRQDNAIPRHQANMMLTICGLRNLIVYENLNPGPYEMAVARGAWGIIVDWWNKTYAE